MLDWTGERFIPGVGAEIAYEHYGRYLFASRFVTSKQVLDMPSGEGFGSFLLAQTARSVVGMDIDEQSLNHARTRYPHPTLDFRLGDMSETIAFPDGSFDIITCFEGIEHIDQTGQNKVIHEFKRLLTIGGILFISTPNRWVYTDNPNHHNPFHIHEFYAEEFREFLSPVFPHISLLGQIAITGGLIAPLDERLSKSAREMGIDFVFPFAQNVVSPLWADHRKWMYFIAVCTKEPSSAVASIIGHLVADPGRSSIAETLENERQQLTTAHLADKSTALAEKDAVVAERDRALGHLQVTLQETQVTLAHKDAVLVERDRALGHLQVTLQETETTLAQKHKDLTIQRCALEDKDRLIVAYEAERRTCGAQVGRWLSRQRNTWAPPTSPQGKMLGLMIRAARILHGQGVMPLGRKAIRFGLHRVRPQRWPVLDWLYTSGLFDAVYYLSTYPDVAAQGMDPAKHYIRFGWQEGRNPHPLFDSAWYLEHNPDIATAGVNPLEHYATVGWQEGRHPHPLFDTSFYLEHNPDVAQAGVNPLWHYATVGWQEGRDPHPLFDTAFYLEHNPDVAQAGVNPLWHYARWGGRRVVIRILSLIPPFTSSTTRMWRRPG